MKLITSTMLPTVLLLSVFAWSSTLYSKPRQLFITQTDTQNLSQDKVYDRKEVDVGAVLKTRPEPKGNFDKCSDEGWVQIKLILHKSGKVTEAEIMKGMGCGFDQACLKSAKKNQIHTRAEERATCITIFGG